MKILESEEDCMRRRIQAGRCVGHALRSQPQFDQPIGHVAV